MTDKSFAAVADDYRAWEDSRSPDLASAEAIIDALLASARGMAEEMGKLDAQITHRAIMITHQANVIAHQARTIDALRAEIARLRTDPARTPLERAVSRLQPWYGFEVTEEPS